MDKTKSCTNKIRKQRNHKKKKYINEGHNFSSPFKKCNCFTSRLNTWNHVTILFHTVSKFLRAKGQTACKKTKCNNADNIYCQSNKMIPFCWRVPVGCCQHVNNLCYFSLRLNSFLSGEEEHLKRHTEGKLQ